MISRFYIKLYIGIFIIVISIILIISIKVFSPYEPKTFRIYYDKINLSILKEMSQNDLNIVEASFFTKEDVDIIHETESKVVGYLSLVEIGYWDTPLVNDLKEEDYLLDDSNEKIKSLSGSNFLGDLSSPHYREVLMKYLDSRILAKGMDGVFFDTLDWIDYYAQDKRLYDKISKGYLALLKEIREKYPNIILVQNRGFESYKEFSKDYIDGILWENFKSPYLDNNEKKVAQLKLLSKIIRKSKTDVYVISFEREEENRALATKLKWNFLYSQMKNRYSEWNIIVR